MEKNPNAGGKTHRQEPLVQPCQCRGSMGGVHASCVEAWVEYHRRNSFQGVVFCVWCLGKGGVSTIHFEAIVCFFFLGGGGGVFLL